MSLAVRVTGAHLAATVTLLLSLLAAALFTVGWRLARRKRFEAHRWVQTGVVSPNAVLVLTWMVRSLVDNVVPHLPEKLGESSYLTATVHAVVGIIGLVVGVYVVLVGNKLLPEGLRFTDYKAFMRSAYALYMLGTLSGVILYAVAYVRF
jgi:uncharacterized membrane protein YozB (DUF420 family)